MIIFKLLKIYGENSKRRELGVELFIQRVPTTEVEDLNKLFK